MRSQCQFTVKRSEKRVDLTVAPEQQPCGVQVVEWVGLVASSFQFFTRLAAVFSIAEKGLGTQVGTQSSCLIIFRLWPRVVPPGLARTTHPL